MAKIKKFLGCFDLEKSVIVVACLEIVLSGFVLSAIVSTSREGTYYFHSSDSDPFDIFLKIIALVCIIKIIACICLIYGVRKRKSCLIVPELIFCALHVLLQFLLFIFTLGDPRMSPSLIPFIFMIYWYLCKITVYQNIKNESILRNSNVESGPIVVTSQIYMPRTSSQQPLISIQNSSQPSVPTHVLWMPQQTSYGFNTNLPYPAQNNNFQQPKSEDLPPSYDQAISQLPYTINSNNFPHPHNSVNQAEKSEA